MWAIQRGNGEARGWNAYLEDKRPLTIDSSASARPLRCGHSPCERGGWFHEPEAHHQELNQQVDAEVIAVEVADHVADHVDSSRINDTDNRIKDRWVPCTGWSARKVWNPVVRASIACLSRKSLT